MVFFEEFDESAVALEQERCCWFGVLHCGNKIGVDTSFAAGCSSEQNDIN